jgi:plastocyanin
MKTALLVVLLTIGIVAVYFLTGSGKATPPAPAAPEPAPAAARTTDAKPTEIPRDAPAANAGVGTLKGVVKYAATPPAPKTIAIPAQNQAECHHGAIADESLVVDAANNGLKWTIVRIVDAQPKDAAPKPEQAPELDQKGCTFSPHVLVVPPNTDLTILNPDKMMHNVHTVPYDFLNLPQNFAISPNQPSATYKAKWLESPELIEFRCDIHTWMKGFVVVHDPRYCAVTGADGSFEIKNLPAGKYKLNIWHEKFGNYAGQETQEIEIKAGGVTDMGELTFKPKH